MIIKVRTLDNLRNSMKGRLYIVCRNTAVGKRFLQDAEAQGYLFGSIKPTTFESVDMVALERHHQLAHVNYLGHMAAGAGAVNCIDYEKYIDGKQNFGYQREETPPVRIRGNEIIGARRKEARDWLRDMIPDIETWEEEQRLYDHAEELFQVIIIRPEDND